MLTVIKNTSSALLFLVLGLTTLTALAQAHVPVPSITDATLDQYRDMYQQSPLCTKAEITLWSCETKKRVFSLCSSPVVTRTTGYMQYRASNAGQLTFAYPAIKTPPLGLFKYNSFGNGTHPSSSRTTDITTASMIRFGIHLPSLFRHPADQARTRKLHVAPTKRCKAITPCASCTTREYGRVTSQNA